LSLFHAMSFLLIIKSLLFLEILYEQAPCNKATRNNYIGWWFVVWPKGLHELTSFSPALFLNCLSLLLWTYLQQWQSQDLRLKSADFFNAVSKTKYSLLNNIILRAFRFIILTGLCDQCSNPNRDKNESDKG
jgi:hypothetical protein